MTSTHTPPKQWNHRRLRFDVIMNPLKSKLEIPPETEVSFVSMDAVGELGGLRLDETRTVEEVYSGYTYFANGDVCIAKITPCFENGKGALAQGLTNGVAFGTTELHVVRPRPGLDARFLFYVSIAHDFRSYGEAEMLGAGGQKRVPEDFLKDWRAPLPPLEPQRRIAAFLDEKTAQIDGLIEKKRTLLDRLAEKRQALITRAVTKGLNPTAPMKPSGIEWLGDIPAHWDLKRLRFVIQTNPTLSSFDLASDLLVSFIPMDAVGEFGGLNLELEKPVSEIGSGYTPFANGDVVVAKITPCFENGNGAFAIGLTNGIAFGTTELHVLRASKRMDSLYVFYLSISNAFRKIGESEMYGAGGQKRISQNFVKDFQVGIPSLDEQERIVSFLVEQIEKVEKIKSRVLSSVDQLAEYRAALVTSAVTGQIAGFQ